jgi:transmembrane sensor
LPSRWTDDRKARVRSGLAARTKRRRAFARTGVALGAMAFVGFIAQVLPRFLHRSAELASSAPSASAAISPASDVTALLDPNSAVVPEPEPTSRTFRLRKGAARFTVTHDAKRPFRVKVGSAVVEDVGTIFTVRRLSETAAEVIVSEGRVHVSSTDASFDVGAGERRTFATEAESVAADAAAEPESRAPPAVASWRPLAESGRFGEAYVMMKATGPSSVRDETGELLLAADVARLSGHPADAVPYLDRILRSRGSDPRAGLAAFTLGRVLLEELGRPAEAASAFGRARKAGGPLAEDALAREVEASSRAGDTGSARTLALEYQKKYPNGRRMRRVVKFGGLD